MEKTIEKDTFENFIVSSDERGVHIGGHPRQPENRAFNAIFNGAQPHTVTISPDDARRLGQSLRNGEEVKIGEVKDIGKKNNFVHIALYERTPGDGGYGIAVREKTLIGPNQVGKVLNSEEREALATSLERHAQNSVKQQISARETTYATTKDVERPRAEAKEQQHESVTAKRGPRVS